MKHYENYVLGEWFKGKGNEKSLHNAINGDLIGYASSEGINFDEVMNYARDYGGAKLRKMTFQERGIMLKKLALHLHSKKKYILSCQFFNWSNKN